MTFEARVRENLHPHVLKQAARVARRVSHDLDVQVGIGFVDDAPRFVVGVEEDVERCLLEDLDEVIAAELERRLNEPTRYAAGDPRRNASDFVLTERVRQANTPGSAHVWYLGASTPWHDGDLFVIVGFARAAIETLPRATLGSGKQGLADHVGRLLAEVLTDRVAAAREPFGYLRNVIADAVMQKAGNAFVSAIAADLYDNSLVGYDSHLFDRLTRIASLRYEGGDNTGSVILSGGERARQDESLFPLPIAFDVDVPLSAATWARKAIELATKDVAVVATATSIIGLVAADAASADRFRIDFHGRNTWRLRQGPTSLLEVTLGEPRLPNRPLLKSTLRETFDRVLGPEHDANALLTLVAAATKAPHGAILVAVKNAETEAARLSAQGTRISPTPLSAAFASAAMRIDGAVLVDPRGQCHAIGVILDGMADRSGSSARGARFNSALRYTRSNPHALAIVVSEDGQIDLFPRLRPPIRAPELAKLIEQIVPARNARPVPLELRGACRRLYVYRELLEDADLDTVLHGAGGGIERILENEDEPDPLDVEYDAHPSDVIDD